MGSCERCELHVNCCSWKCQCLISCGSTIGRDRNGKRYVYFEEVGNARFAEVDVGVGRVFGL